MKTLEDARSWLEESHKDPQNGWPFRRLGVDIEVVGHPQAVMASFVSNYGSASIQVWPRKDDSFVVRVRLPMVQLTVEDAEDFAEVLTAVSQYGKRLRQFMGDS